MLIILFANLNKDLFESLFPDWEPSVILYLIAIELMMDAVTLGILASLIQNVVFHG